MGIKLTRVEIHNYRSIFEDSGGTPFVFQLSPGANALVGPNNCGKSNVLKAIALALEEGEEGTFDERRDTPQQKLWARPTITLEFVADGPTGPEETLLRYLDDYERSALQEEAKSTSASKGRIKLRVKYTKAGRDEFFITAAGGRRGTPELNRRALEQFRKVVRFVLVRSGESVENFLEGRFRDLLHTVLQENLWKQVKAAEEQRLAYQAGVADSVYGPVSRLVEREIGQIIPEIQRVEIEPRVLGIEETLATAGISLVDGAKTGLAEKGTGARGSLLLAMLRYIAENSKRSVIFAIEEPEAFLHPAAQEEVRDDLEALAERDDVTLLVTTHSPFVISRSTNAQCMAIAKDQEGRTRISQISRGDADHRGVFGSLFNDTLVPDYLERASRLPAGVRGFVVVEGFTDAEYLRLAAERAKPTVVADGIEVVWAEGAKSAAVQAVLLHQAHGLPVVVLLDYEPEPEKYLEMLRNTFGFAGEATLTYREWGSAPKSADPVEAEGLFPAAFLEAFVAAAGEEVVLSEKVKRKSGGWRYGFTQAGKGLFLPHVGAKATSADLATFADVWRSLVGRIDKLEERSARKAAFVAEAAS